LFHLAMQFEEPECPMYLEKAKVDVQGARKVSSDEGCLMPKANIYGATVGMQMTQPQVVEIYISEFTL
jgi:hypothetical protein